MKKTVFILVAFFVIFSGCVQPPVPLELPQDFEIEYGTGAEHISWGQSSLKIDSSGNAVFKKTIGGDLDDKEEFTVTESERKKIYNTAMANNFFSLNDLYEDLFIMDGGWSEITIKANGETKTVRLKNYNENHFQNVEAEIKKLIVSKIGQDAFSFNDLQMRNEIYCEQDSDCACGMHMTTKECFVGNKDLIKVGQQCTGFCTGSSGNMETKCVENTCVSLPKQ